MTDTRHIQKTQHAHVTYLKHSTCQQQPQNITTGNEQE